MPAGRGSPPRASSCAAWLPPDVSPWHGLFQRGDRGCVTKPSDRARAASSWSSPSWGAPTGHGQGAQGAQPSRDLPWSVAASAALQPPPVIAAAQRFPCQACSGRCGRLSEEQFQGGAAAVSTSPVFLRVAHQGDERGLRFCSPPGAAPEPQREPPPRALVVQGNHEGYHASFVRGSGSSAAWAASARTQSSSSCKAWAAGPGITGEPRRIPSVRVAWARTFRIRVPQTSLP